MATQLNQIPTRVVVRSCTKSRYTGNHKPSSWDTRIDGIDEIETEDGSKIKLYSDGGQDSPQTGWVIVLTGGDPANGYTWTLYGLPHGATINV